jgi:hypothetical protein
MRRMRASLGRSIVTVLAAAVSLTGCSAGSLVEQLPPSLGLPAGVPAQPVTPYQYPAVHDMPPPRSDTPLTAEQQLEMEQQLTTLRDRQEGAHPADKNAKETKETKAIKTTKKAAKKQPAPVSNTESPGAKSNP